MTSKLVGKNGTIRATCRQRLCVPIDNLLFPEAISINQPFTIQWLNTQEGEMSEINFTAKEICFDNDSRNVSIQKSSLNKADITIKDYGHYEITMTLKNNPSIKRVVHIEKYYHPNMYCPGYQIDAESYDYREKMFEIGYECDENPKASAIVSSNPGYLVKLDEGTTIQQRLYFRLYDKYYRGAYPVVNRRVTFLHVTDSNSFRNYSFSKGASVDFTTPVSYNRQSIFDPPIEFPYNGDNPNAPAIGIVGRLTYQGYFALVIPDDMVYED